MKMSILLGVVHMNLGIVMSLMNNLYFKDRLSTLCEFVPQVGLVVSGLDRGNVHLSGFTVQITGYFDYYPSRQCDCHVLGTRLCLTTPVLCAVSCADDFPEWAVWLPVHRHRVQVADSQDHRPVPRHDLHVPVTRWACLDTQTTLAGACSGRKGGGGLPTTCMSLPLLPMRGVFGSRQGGWG
jgi:hypothetical protein